MPPPQNPEAVANCILSLLADEDYAKKLGANGYALINAKYNINEIKKNIEAVYLKILDEKSQAPPLKAYFLQRFDTKIIS